MAGKPPMTWLHCAGPAIRDGTGIPKACTGEIQKIWKMPGLVTEQVHIRYTWRYGTAQA